MTRMLALFGAISLAVAPAVRAQPWNYRMAWSANYGAHASIGGEIPREIGGDGVLLATNDLSGADQHCRAEANGGVLQGFASGWPNAAAMGRAEFYDTWTVGGDPGYVSFTSGTIGTLRLVQYDPVDPNTWVLVYYRGELFRWETDHWTNLARFEPWAPPDGNKLASTDSVQVDRSFQVNVWVQPGDRLLTAAILLPMASTREFSQYPYPSAAGSGDSDFAHSAITLLRPVDPGVVLTSAASRDATPLRPTSWGRVKQLWR